jgi:hypothetical protein
MFSKLAKLIDGEPENPDDPTENPASINGLTVVKDEAWINGENWYNGLIRFDSLL